MTTDGRSELLAAYLERRVFRLHKFEGLSHPEVAQALGISRSRVEKHVMAALKWLAERRG